MPYTQTVWQDGVTMGNQTRLNNLEQQYLEATNSLEQDVWTAFVLSGLAASGTVGTNTVSITAGVAFLKQSDNTLRRRAPTTSTQTTSTPSSTYHLYLQPDGTWYWSTSNSPAANSLFIAQVTTDGSGNIATITDERVVTTTLFTGFGAGGLGFLNIPGLITVTTNSSARFRWGATLSGANRTIFDILPADGTHYAINLNTDGSLTIRNTTTGFDALKIAATTGNTTIFGSISTDGGTLTTDGSGNVTAVSFMGKLKTVRNGTGQANTIFTGSTTPVGPAVGDIWLNQ